ncbi:MAG: RNA polymerase sigma factor [Candidatus Kapabacteria bacterium]|nr:RNA polymerase sigma factor [Ignavibacteriota bacterium]MCW5883671.1 RNA polymerase sigma factor [Candidatus Kapabacteria bacterium]
MKNFNKYSDNDLIQITANSGEPEKSAAFSELYNRYANNIYLYCRKIFGDGTFAEDIFQDTFLQLLKCIENKIYIGNVQGYLLKTARNLSLNFRRNQRAEMVEFDDFRANIDDNSYELKELSEMIDSALELLPEEHKEAFILQSYQGLSYSEIATLTDVPLSTVRNRIVRAKAKLREILAPMIKEEKL